MHALPAEQLVPPPAPAGHCGIEKLSQMHIPPSFTGGQTQSHQALGGQVLTSAWLRLPTSLVASTSMPASASLSLLRQLTPASDRTAIKATDRTTSPMARAIIGPP